MDIGTIIIIIIVGVLLILVFYVIGVYNSLVNARNKVKDQFSQIDVQLKRRSDMIPNLVETVKGYAKHEEKTLKEVIEETEAEYYYFNELIHKTGIESYVIDTDNKSSEEVLGNALQKVREIRR